MMKNKVFLLFIPLVFCSRLPAQVGFSFDVEQGHSSNAFSNYRSLPDDFLAVEAALYYDLIYPREGLRFFYQPDFTWFRAYSYRAFSTHAIGTLYFLNLNEKKDRLTAGISLRSRNHSDEYQWFEFQQINANIDWRLTFADQLIGYAGLYGYARSYARLSPFSHGMVQGYFRLSKFFESGTTLMAEADLMQKQYIESENGNLPEEFPDYVSDGDGVNRQFVGMFKVAQSVNPNLGINGQLLFRRNVANSVRYLVSSEGEYYSDEELFDDVFGYDGEQYRLSAKQRLFWKMILEISASYSEKRYLKRYALDLEGNPFDDLTLRHDHRAGFSFSLKKPINLSESTSPLLINLDYSAIDNRSNDPYYQYRAHYFSVSLSKSF